MNKKFKILVTVSLLISLEIILTRFLSITTPIVRIGFGFLPIAICGMLYGPVWAGTAGLISDLIGAILFPSGAYFPGFTLSAILTGVIFGFFLHDKEMSSVKLLFAVLINNIGISLLLNTLWLTILTGSPFIALIPTRILQSVLMVGVQFIVIKMMNKPVSSFMKNQMI